LSRPRTLAVSDVQYLLTFGVMLTVGLLIGNLTAGVRYQARVARYREQRTRHLYEMSKRWRWVAASRISPPPASGLSPPRFRPAASCCSRTPRKLLPLTHQPGLTPWDDAIARWSFDKGQPAGAGTDTCPACPIRSCR
jgi:two-component system sensor histidine kinase KdpD